MKILFNTDQIYMHGGIEKVMATKANFFANLEGFEVYILTTEQKNRDPRYNLDSRIRIVDMGINYNRQQSYFTIKNIGKTFKHFWKQKENFKHIRPDIIISPNYNFDHYWLPFIKTSKSKVIKEIHASGYSKHQSRINASFISKIKWYFHDFILAKYQAVVVLNEDEKKYQKTSNVVVIPNPMEGMKQQALLKNKQVIAAGRIAPVKAFDKLIKAWEIVHKKQPQWQLHIYGDGYLDTKIKLEKLIQSLELQKVILFKDSVSNIPRTMLEYSIYAMSSDTECFPMVLLEAQSAGLPIVSFDCPNGPRHIINHQKDGLLIKTTNYIDLAVGLLTIIENDTLRLQMGTNAKKNVKFEINTVMQLWIILFENLNQEKV